MIKSVPIGLAHQTEMSKVEAWFHKYDFIVNLDGKGCG